jgi:hypothetical protein
MMPENYPGWKELSRSGKAKNDCMPSKTNDPIVICLAYSLIMRNAAKVTDGHFYLS